MRKLSIKAGERQRVLHLLFDSIPQQVRFRAEASDGSGSVGGEVGVIGSTWLFRKPEVIEPLKTSNVFEKGFLDTRYSIFVTPERDCDITFETRHFTGRMLAIAILIVLALGIGSPLFFALMRASGG